MIKKDIKAVHDEDLERVLKDLNIFEDIQAGRKKCKFCSTVINYANLQALFPESGDIKIICDKTECVKKLYELLGEQEIS